MLKCTLQKFHIYKPRIYVSIHAMCTMKCANSNAKLIFQQTNSVEINVNNFGCKSDKKGGLNTPERVAMKLKKKQE